MENIIHRTSTKNTHYYCKCQFLFCNYDDAIADSYILYTNVQCDD